MKLPLHLLLPTLLLTLCTPAKQETSGTDSTSVAQTDTATVKEVTLEEPEESSAPVTTLTPQNFDEIPGDLQDFLSAVVNADVSVLAAYIHPNGCYLIEEGPGVYPIVTEIKSVEDLSKSLHFTLFMNTPKLYSGYYINNEDVDPCSLPAEGIFFSDARKDSHLLFNSYTSSVSAAGDEVSEEMKTKLNQLDAALGWYGSINLPSKSGELNTFDICIALIDGKYYLSGIDTRGCGI
jgi:hypothetical protein